MIKIKCQNKKIDSFFIEVNENLYLEKRSMEGHLYINGIRAKALPGGAHYQMIEPELFRQFDEICQQFNDDAEIDIDKETFLPLTIKIEGKNVLTIEFESNSTKIMTKIGLNQVRHLRNIFENVFKNKIIPLLQKVNLYA
ncbi:hypothetical protein AVT98_gp41 [Sulfolobales virus YNP1]|uniref:hypothetical protein n=1 Tax=Sulfolobales virus YNP1 TaxID=1732179 RepID=UPI0007061D26|nr:hypothetical protein AVT98_gp41 [Sulfolobales virus YNP1]ALG97133.1 hypothetical protein [Sulfolobales virus YNP1]